MVITSASLTTTEVRYLAANTPTADFRVLVPRVDGVRYYFEHRTTHFYLLHNNATAVNFQLDRVPITNTSVLYVFFLLFASI